MTFSYRFYQLFVALPLLLTATILTALITSVGCLAGNGHVWGYYPGKCWSWLVCRLLLLPVRIEGREHIRRNQSYVFVANHQGAMDIFLVYGFLGRNFKWMMKKSLRKIPLVGYACERAGFIFVDKTGKKLQETMAQALRILQDGTSLVVFPEGSRTFTGRMGAFRKGAFLLADELQLPVVPLTIDGSFDILPRTHGISFVRRRPLRLLIHPPIFPTAKGQANVQTVMEQAYAAVMAGLPEKSWQSS